MAALNKGLYQTWMAQNALTTIEQNFAANFYALALMSAGNTLGLPGGDRVLKFDAQPLWTNTNQRAMYFRAFMLIDPNYETADTPIWENMINDVEEIPSDKFGQVFKIIP